MKRKSTTSYQYKLAVLRNILKKCQFHNSFIIFIRRGNITSVVLLENRKYNNKCQSIKSHNYSLRFTHLDKLHHKINCNLWDTLSYEHYLAGVMGELVFGCVGERINLNDTSCLHYCIILQLIICNLFKSYLFHLVYRPLTRIFVLLKKLKIRFCIECD